MRCNVQNAFQADAMFSIVFYSCNADAKYSSLSFVLNCSKIILLVNLNIKQFCSLFLNY